MFNALQHFYVIGYDENLIQGNIVLISYSIVLQADGFPTLLFFPAGNKSFDPVSGIWWLNIYVLSVLFSFWYAFFSVLLV